MGNLFTKSNDGKINEISASIRLVDRNSRIIENDNKVIVEDIASRFLKL